MKKCILLVLLSAFALTSCDDWLDVRGGNAVKEEDQFSSYKGFRDALTGCYMAMADRQLYGQRLTMTTTELLANLWYCEEDYKTSQPEYYYLTRHLYTEDAALTAVDEIYRGLFNVIAQANLIILHAEQDGSVIGDEAVRSVIAGEAYAIRAYCQLDVLRLFGQLPQGGTEQVSLPYSFTTGVDEVPAYYAWDKYVELLKADIDRALTLLKDNDPVFRYSFGQLNSPSVIDMDDSYFYYRQFRLNYWAVKALQARLSLYVGETDKAHETASEIIRATGADGEPVMELSGVADLAAGYYACPSECLFSLSRYDINTYANQVLNGGLNEQLTSKYLQLTPEMLTQLYASIASTTGSHNRYSNTIWNRTSQTPGGTVRPTLKKYWYAETTTDNLMLKHQIIPMLRMSEVYLIAIETASDLGLVNRLYATYMEACAVQQASEFASLDEVRAEMLNEYRREFFGEGQMFYAYKRRNEPAMLWRKEAVAESEYILPLPQSEYNPNH